VAALALRPAHYGAEMPSTARGQRTRERIIEAASAVFEEKGFSAATMNHLVAATGLTKGAFYFHFESKDALAVAIAEEQAQRWQWLLAEVARREQDPMRRLVALVCGSASAYRDDPTVRAASRLLLDRGLIRRELPETARWWMDTVEGLFREAHASGQLMDVSFLHRVTPLAGSGDVGTDDHDGSVRTLTEYLVSALAMVGQAAVSRPDSQFDLLYVHWAMILPRICADPARADELLTLARDLLTPPA
jgi:AcrR family transcriptional regulator